MKILRRTVDGDPPSRYTATGGAKKLRKSNPKLVLFRFLGRAMVGCIRFALGAM
jgi:hypothetical protein